MGRPGSGCALCPQRNRGGIVGICTACGKAVCDHHARWKDGELLCSRDARKLPKEEQRALLVVV